MPDTWSSILDELLEVPTTLDGWTFRPTHRRITHIAHGWYMRVDRGTNAVLLLDREGMEEEAAPIRRSIIEHVVGLRWLVAEGNQAAKRSAEPTLSTPPLANKP